MSKKDVKLKSVVDEAVKILKDYPHLKYYEAIAKAKEVINGESTKNLRS